MARLVLFEGELTVLILLKDLLILLLRLVFNRVLLVFHLLPHWVLLVSGVCHKKHLFCLSFLSPPLSEFHLPLVLLLGLALCLSLCPDPHLLFFFQSLLAKLQSSGHLVFLQFLLLSVHVICSSCLRIS